MNVKNNLFHVKEYMEMNLKDDLEFVINYEYHENGDMVNFRNFNIHILL